MSLTLGDVLTEKFISPIPEEEWADLLACAAAGDQPALHALYERSHRIVFTLAMRITANRIAAEEITLCAFHDIWEQARDYDAANDTVPGWIVKQARLRAIDHLQTQDRKTHTNDGASPDPDDVSALGEQRTALSAALDALTPDERQAIESIFFTGLTHAQAGARLSQPLGTLLRSGLHKLRHAVRGGPATALDEPDCGWSEVTCAYTLHALPPDEVEPAIAHLTSCPSCHREMETLRPLVDSFVAWPVDVLRPRVSLQARLARRIAAQSGKPPELQLMRQWSDPDWLPVAPGIECSLLAADAQRQRVSMLVRFAPGARYVAHTHAWNEECHILDGGLQIDDCELLSGDYMCSAPDSRHTNIHSQAGCTCFVVTSTADSLG